MVKVVFLLKLSKKVVFFAQKVVFYSISRETLNLTPLRRLTLNTRGANGFSPEKPLFTITIDASIAMEYYKRLGVKFFRTRFTPITMVVYIT